jgi:hypothetical protein
MQFIMFAIQIFLHLYLFSTCKLNFYTVLLTLKIRITIHVLLTLVTLSCGRSDALMETLGL